MMQIKEFAEITGTSVRTLHFYDEIGLLKPARVDVHTGYRYYDEQSLLRMQEICFYRELAFPLKSIRAILSSPDYDRRKAMEEQRKLLVLKKERLERLIAAIDKAEKGENVMGTFSNSEYEAYKAEAQARWGKTDAYAEYQIRAAHTSKETWDAAAKDMDAIFAAFASCAQNGNAPDAEEAQNLVKTLQNHITAQYYTCTDEILFGLGQMYTADERFRKNIDQHGAGTAAFAAEAISIYCKH